MDDFRLTKFLLRFAVCLVLSSFGFRFPVPGFAQDRLTPLFDLNSADGMIGSGPLAQLREDWSISLGGKTPVQAKGTSLVALRRSKTPLPPPPRKQHVLLTNGDRIAGTPLQLSGERIRFNSQLGTEAELTLPLSAITLFWFAAPDGVEDREKFHQRLATERRKRDTVHLRNGDLLEGTMTALDSTTVEIDVGNGKTAKIAREKVATIALSTELARHRRTKGLYTRLTLSNGDRLSLQSARADDQALTGKTLFGAMLQVPVKDIVALDVYHGCAVYLSDLKPLRYTHTPYLDIRWPYTLDQSVAGNQIRVAGSTYDKGIGMHSQSRLTYELDGKYRWFEAWAGLDDRTGRDGSALIQVLVDGKPGDLGEAKELIGPDQIVPVRVSVAGARELTLVVLFGRRGDVQDHVDWADARLIK